MIAAAQAQTEKNPIGDFNSSPNAVTYLRRFDVEYFFVCLDVSTEKLIDRRAISDYFATLELAQDVQTRLKALYPDCLIQGTKRYFKSEHDRDRLELLAIIRTEDPDRYNVTCFYLTIESSFENKLFQKPIFSFLTEDQARAAGAIAKKYHSKCGIQMATGLFTREDTAGRQSMLSSRINDTLDNIKAGAAAYFEAENAKLEA